MRNRNEPEHNRPTPSCTDLTVLKYKLAKQRGPLRCGKQSLHDSRVLWRLKDYKFIVAPAIWSQSPSGTPRQFANQQQQQQTKKMTPPGGLRSAQGTAAPQLVPLPAGCVPLFGSSTHTALALPTQLPGSMAQELEESMAPPAPLAQRGIPSFCLGSCSVAPARRQEAEGAILNLRGGGGKGRKKLTVWS